MDILFFIHALAIMQGFRDNEQTKMPAAGHFLFAKFVIGHPCVLPDTFFYMNDLAICKVFKIMHETEEQLNN